MRAMDPPVTIRIGRRLALTIDQLAAELGRQPNVVRALLSKRGITPDGHVNARTPVWLAEPTLAQLRPKRRERSQQ